MDSTLDDVSSVSDSAEGVNVVHWLIQLSKYDKFDSMMQFAPADLVEKSVDCIQRHIEFITLKGQSDEELSYTLNKYSNFKSD